MENTGNTIVTPAKLVDYPFEADTERMIPYLFENYGELDEQGYIEKELLCTGVDEFGKEYTTVAMLRLPADPHKFSGVIVAEPFHICPMLPLYVYAAKAILHGNHGWIAIGSQKSTVEKFVIEANPARYSMVHIEGGKLTAKEREFDFTNVPNDHDEADPWYDAFLRYNRACSSILAEVGAALKANAGMPAGYAVKHVILGGHSFTGFMTTRYILHTHDTLRMPDGSPIYEGFFPSGWPAVIFKGYDVPIVQTITAADICTENAIPVRYGCDDFNYRRADADAPNDRFRLYEFPGFGHASMQFPPTDEIDFVLSITQPALSLPAGAISSTLPFVEYHAAALDRLIRWVVEGIVPSKEERLVYNDTGSKDIFKKDANGNTLGGVRCPQMDVPTSVYLSNTYNEDGSVRFGGNGFEVPFTPEKLRALYGTKEHYLELFGARVQKAVEDGWLYAEDGAAIVEKARAIAF